jgi:hypothetical protein
LSVSKLPVAVAAAADAVVAGLLRAAVKAVAIEQQQQQKENFITGFTGIGRASVGQSVSHLALKALY